MAQVLAPLIQTSATVTMLQSSPDAYTNPQNQPLHQQQGSSQMQRGQIYNGQTAGTGYRGTSAPIAPYAFSSTPQLRHDNRSAPGPNAHNVHHQHHSAHAARAGYPSHQSSSSDSTVSTTGSSGRSFVSPSTAKDDFEHRKSVIDGQNASIGGLAPELSLGTADAIVKPSPGRYRRGAGRTDSSSSVTTVTPNTNLHSPPLLPSPTFGASQPTSTVALGNVDQNAPSRPSHSRANSVDDMQVSRNGGQEHAKRYRRRSLSGLDVSTAAGNSAPPASTEPTSSTASKRPDSGSSRQGSRPSSSQSHERQGSSGSVSSTASSRPIVSVPARPLDNRLLDHRLTRQSRHENPTQRSPAANVSTTSAKTPESARRIAPSPLSQPLSPTEPSSPGSPRKADAAAAAPSPAMRQLSALNDKDGGRGMKSRLRRAFSFGSAAELRRASAENNLSTERAKLRKERYQNDEDAEQAAIVAKQEAAGIGAGIYSGQGGFSGSTDNLSISSTASSASIMLRKMGNGMKKGGRSIKGLFRPKSVIGVPAADGPITQPSVGQVSMVTVEAERQKVNVNLDPHDQIGGGTGYPRLERNSLDAARSTDMSDTTTVGTDSMSRKSIIGGERERAEVLSSIKKGILKRNGLPMDAPSPVLRPVDIPHTHESPKSSAPSTPSNEHSQDYFAGPPRLGNLSTRSLPTTPHGSLRNISFSPRIQFHDAWSPADYDRRGEIATCNRLTPMLAQQIKEELNSFKMEMEVHELSKPHTHFF